MRFHVADPAPGIKLRDIAPLHVRARAWVARIAPNSSNVATIQTIGAISFLEGLDYHFTRFGELLTSLEPYYSRLANSSLLDWDHSSGLPAPRLIPTDAETKFLDSLDHEAVAYLNRLGQFYYFGRARGLTPQLPKTSYLMAFRRKYTAHRSIDAPQGESQQEREYQAMAFGFYRLTRSGVPTYQLTADRKHREFQMPRDHPVVMEEAVNALFSLHPPPSDA